MPSFDKSEVLTVDVSLLYVDSNFLALDRDYFRPDLEDDYGHLDRFYDHLDSLSHAEDERLDRLLDDGGFDYHRYDDYDESEWRAEMEAQNEFFDSYLPPHSSREQEAHRKGAQLKVDSQAELFNWPPRSQKKCGPRYVFRSKHWRESHLVREIANDGDFNSRVLDALASLDTDNDEFFVLCSMGFPDLARALES